MLHQEQRIIIERDCDAVLIPAGSPIRIPGGTEVVITQSLGGSYTVFVNGNLARIEGKDADALGIEPDAAVSAAPVPVDGPADAAAVQAVLKTCYDPEIPVDIVELGLVYDCRVEGNKVSVLMTLTAPGCGMGEYLKADVEQKLHALPNVSEVEVELTFDPPWDRSRMSDAAKLALGMF